jgi:hypothetical protein
VLTSSFSSEALTQLQPEIRILLMGSGGKSSTDLADHIAALGPPAKLLEMAEWHGTSALLLQAVGETGGVSNAFTSSLRKQALAIAAGNLRLAAEFSRIAAAFAAAGIPLIPYKGPLFAERVYGSMALRPSGDLDIIIEPADLNKSLKTLTELGYFEPYSFSAAERRLYERAEAGYECAHPRGFVADLHFCIVPPHFCVALDNASLFARSRVFNYSGRELRMLSPEDEFLVLALHGSKHCWQRLIWLCDVQRLLAAEPELDWDLVLHRATQLHTQRTVFLAAFLAATYLRAPVPAVVLASCRHDPAILRLANTVVSTWASLRQPSRPHRWRFILATRERARDRWACALSYAVVPTLADCEAVALPSWLSILYPAVRAFRLLSQLARAAVPGALLEDAPTSSAPAHGRSLQPDHAVLARPTRENSIY